MGTGRSCPSKSSEDRRVVLAPSVLPPKNGGYRQVGDIPVTSWTPFELLPIPADSNVLCDSLHVKAKCVQVRATQQCWYTANKQ